MRRLIALTLIVTVVLVGFVLIAQANTYSKTPISDRLAALARQNCSLNQGVWDWIECVQKAWIYEPDHPGELCQTPQISKRCLKGDCDDFAVMVAYYLQEYWKYDTYIVNYRQKNHYVAFLWVTKAVKDAQAKKCKGYYPYQTWRGRIYIPIDWTLCPDWNRSGWENLPSMETYEWKQLVGEPI
ncbi:MAG: hypothetical protein U9Q76_05020 [candidate division WOR-3 bacterium]|nr:hypothetical protein [candidate division WOR-3 bacterium]